MKKLLQNKLEIEDDIFNLKRKLSKLQGIYQTIKDELLTTCHHNDIRKICCYDGHRYDKSYICNICKCTLSYDQINENNIVQTVTY